MLLNSGSAIADFTEYLACGIWGTRHNRRKPRLETRIALSLPVILLPLLFLNSTPAYAEWMEIDNGKPGMTIYVNPDTIHRTGNLVTMWELYDFETAEHVAEHTHLSFKTHSEYHCSDGQTRWRQATYFSGNMGRGKIVYRHQPEDSLKSVPVNSVSHDLWTFACDKK